MSMSKYASRADYWQARCVAAENKLIALHSGIDMGVAHPILASQIDQYFEAVTDGSFAASSRLSEEGK